MNEDRVLTFPIGPCSKPVSDTSCVKMASHDVAPPPAPSDAVDRNGLRRGTRPEACVQARAGSPRHAEALMKLLRTSITRAKFPALDSHLHGRALRTAADYQKLVKLMDDTGIGVICNMDGGFGKDSMRRKLTATACGLQLIVQETTLFGQMPNRSGLSSAHFSGSVGMCIQSSTAYDRYYFNPA
jgi:hypothetical protein